MTNISPNDKAISFNFINDTCIGSQHPRILSRAHYLLVSLVIRMRRNAINIDKSEAEDSCQIKPISRFWADGLQFEYGNITKIPKQIP